jgi:hypothetical protein
MCRAQAQSRRFNGVINVRSMQDPLLLMRIVATSSQRRVSIGVIAGCRYPNFNCSVDTDSEQYRQY